MPEQTLIERVAHLVNTHASAKQVFAEPIERDGTTIIPVAQIHWGFGGGALGHGALERGGGGGGVRATPAGFIRIRNGEAEFHHYRDSSQLAIVLGAALAGIGIGLLMGKARGA